MSVQISSVAKPSLLTLIVLLWVFILLQSLNVGPQFKSEYQDNGLVLATVTVDLQVQGDDDDAREEDDNTTFSRTSSIVRMDGDTSASGATRYNGGHRFTGVNVPQGALINNATLEVYVYDSIDDLANVDIHAEPVDNSVDFFANADVTSRARTSASTLWFAPGSGYGFGWEISPDISSVIQEIIDRPGWIPGNALTILVDGRSDIDNRDFESRSRDYSSVTNYGAKLHITYTESFPDPPTVVGAGATPDGAFVNSVSDPLVPLRIKDNGPTGTYPNTYHWNQFQVYRDNGDGTFNSSTDTLVQENSESHLTMTEPNYPPGGEVGTTYWIGGETSGQIFFWRARLNNDGSDFSTAPPEAISPWSSAWSFTVDNDAPTSTINQPSCNLASGPVSITGTASDALSGVAQTAVAVQRQSDGFYWDWVGSSWINPGSPLWSYAVGTTSWSIDTSSVVWTAGQNYTVFSSAEDSVIGSFNVETPATSLGFIVGTCDLQITDITYVPVSDATNPTESGIAVSTSVSVKNFGAVAINSAFDVSFCWDNADCAGTTLSPESISSILADETQVVIFSFTAPTVAGLTSYTGKATADSGSVVLESDETNNEALAGFSIIPKQPESCVLTTGGDVGAKGRIEGCDQGEGSQTPQPSFVYVAVQGANAVTVVDVRDLANPVITGSVTDVRLGSAYDVASSGNYAYVITKSGGTLIVVDVSDPANPFIPGPNPDSGTLDDPLLNGSHGVATSGDYAYVAARDGSPGNNGGALTIVDVRDPENPVIAGSVDDPLDRLKSPWGVVFSGQYAYVTGSVTGSSLFGTEKGNTLVVVDVDNPVAPFIAGSVGDPSSSSSARSVAVSGNYAYLVDRSNILTVVDISDPTNPTLAGSISDPKLDGDYEIAVSGNYAYVVSPLTDTLTVVDVSDPTNPVIAGPGPGSINDPLLLNGAHGISVFGDYAYVAARDGGAANNGALTIVDVSDPANPVITGPGPGSVSDSSLNGLRNVALASVAAPIGLPYAIHTADSAGMLDMKGSTSIIGDVYSNGCIVSDSTCADLGADGTETIAGDVFVGNGISSAISANVTGTIYENGPPNPFPGPQVLPDIGISDWVAEADAGEQLGTTTWSSGDRTLGPTKITGNLTIDGISSLTINGPVHITGNLIYNGNDTPIILNDSLGSGGTAIVVDGLIETFRSINISPTNSSPKGFLFIVSTNTTSSSDMEIQTITGHAVFYSAGTLIPRTDGSTVLNGAILGPSVIFGSSGTNIIYDSDLLNWSPDPPPPPFVPGIYNADYLVVADSTITNFYSAVDWLVESYSGGINTGLAADEFQALWDQFGNGGSTDHAANGVIPDTRGIYAYPSIAAINSGSTGPPEVVDFTWDGTGASANTDPVVLFINGNLNINANLDLASKKVVFIVKGNINVSGTAGGGTPVISYNNANANILKVAKCLDDSCTTSTLTDIDFPADNSKYTSLAIGTDGFPVISYMDNGNTDLKVAKCLDDDCNTSTITTLDNTIEARSVMSLAIGTDGFPVISYYSSNRLKVAKCLDAACTASTNVFVDGSVIGNTVGDYSSLAIGTDGFPVISYWSESNTDLKVAKCLDAACTASTITTVDSSRDDGEFTSLAISNDGFPVISYYDAQNENLKVAKCLDDACTTSTITTIDSVGFNNFSSISIVISNDNFPVISYYDAINTSLKVAKCLDEDCTTSTITTVDSVGDVGEYSSITLSNDGFPVIGYHDTTNTSLKVAKCLDDDCTAPATITTVDPSGQNVGQGASIAIGSGITKLQRIDGFYISSGIFNSGVAEALIAGDCPECQLVVNGGVIAFGGVNLNRNLGTSSSTIPAVLFNYKPEYIYIFATTSSPGASSLLGNDSGGFEEVSP